MLKRIIILCHCLLLLTGCWSSKEITELMIVTGMAIDKDHDSENYVVTLQVINPGEIASQTKTERLEVTSYQTKGKTIFEAMRRISTEVPRRMYLAHIQLIIFGEDFAKEGIGEALDFLSRDHELRSDFFILVSKDGKGEDVLNILTPTEANPSVSLYASIDVSEKIWAPSKGVQLDELLNTLMSEGKNPVLTGVSISGDLENGDEVVGLQQVKPAAVMKIIGYAGFKKDKLVGWLDESESKGYNYIINNVKRTVKSVPCDDGYVGLEVYKTNSEMRTNVKNGSPSITIEMNVESNIGEVQCKMDLNKTESLEKLEKKAVEEIKKRLEASVTKAKEDLKSDIFGFGEAIHREHPKEWKKLKDNWEEAFLQLEVNYKINYEIKRLGTISNPVIGDIE